MNKKEVGKSLAKSFGIVHVQGWLSKFPDDYVWNKNDYHKEFVKYINSLDNTGNFFHPGEMYNPELD